MKKNKRKRINYVGFLYLVKNRHHKSIGILRLKNYINTIVEILGEHIVDDRMILIDGFGTISRMKKFPRKIRNINTKEVEDIVSDTAIFCPHKSFIKLMRKRFKKMVI